MDADKLLSDRLDQQCCDDRAVHTAGEREQDLFIADLGAQFFDLLFDECICERFCGDALHGFWSDIGTHNVKPPITLKYGSFIIAYYLPFFKWIYDA